MFFWDLRVNFYPFFPKNHFNKEIESFPIYIYIYIYTHTDTLNKSSLLSNRWPSHVHVVSDGNVSIRKYYKQAWNSVNVILPKCKRLCFSYVGFRAKESVLAGNFTAQLYSKEICSWSTQNSFWDLRLPCSVGNNMQRLV